MISKAPKREPQEFDQFYSQQAIRVLQKAMDENPEIESTIWAGVLWLVLVDSYFRSGATYEQFCEECNNVKNAYKKMWD